MRAIVCTEIGPPENLTVEEREEPQPGGGQLVIDVAAAGVNFADGLFVTGRYQITPQVPFVPGGEVAGTVVAVGDGVDGLAKGDRVIASIGLGAYADQVIANPFQGGGLSALFSTHPPMGERIRRLHQQAALIRP